MPGRLALGGAVLALLGCIDPGPQEGAAGDPAGARDLFEAVCIENAPDLLDATLLAIMRNISQGADAGLQDALAAARVENDEGRSCAVTAAGTPPDNDPLAQIAASFAAKVEGTADASPDGQSHLVRSPSGDFRISRDTRGDETTYRILRQ